MGQGKAAVVMASCVIVTVMLTPSGVDAGAAVPPPDAAAYIHQHQQALHGDQRSSTSGSAKPTATPPPSFGGSLPGISSQLRVNPRSTLRQRVAARREAVESRVPLDADTSADIAREQHEYAKHYAPHIPAVSSTFVRSESAESTSSSTPSSVQPVSTLTKTPLAPSAPSTASPPATSGLSPKAILFMTLLSLQFGLQPLLVRRFTPPSINKSTVVFVQEIIKLVISVKVYLSTTSREQQRSDWGDGGRPHLLLRQLAIAGLPAALYCVQNLASLLAYQNLDPVQFNVLNQTKTLSAALCCFLVLGARQSGLQMAALGMLLSAALVLEKILPVSMLIPGLGRSVSGAAGVGAASAAAAASGGVSRGLLATLSGLISSLSSGSTARRVTHGVLPILLASFLSGLAGALVQKAVQGGGQQVRRIRAEAVTQSSTAASVPSRPKNFYLFSTELGLASIFLLLISFVFSGDGRRIAANGFFHGWTPSTLVPILTQSAGGIVVGLVTKYAGSVRKGFALIFGMLLSGLVQAWSTGGALGFEQMVGLVLASASLLLHTRYPYRPKPRGSIIAA